MNEEIQFRLAMHLHVFACRVILSDTFRNAFRNALQHIFIYFEKHFKRYTRMTCSATKMRCSRRKHAALTYCVFWNCTAEKTLGKTTRFGTSGNTFWSWTTELRFDDFLNQESTDVSKNMHTGDSLQKSTRPSSKYIAIIYK